jgi:hypothetical protein
MAVGPAKRIVQTEARDLAAGKAGALTDVIASDQRERGNLTALSLRDCFGRSAPSQ